jgi:hypothetical protein
MVDSGDGTEQSPADMAAIIGQYEARHAMAQANSQHAVMKQFMKNFARNMRLSVLKDSRGDMPEEERQRLIAKAEADAAPSPVEAAAEGGGMEPGASPVEGDAESEEMPPPLRHVPHRPHMLNMAEARHAHRRQRHQLLPEAEGIGFPPPPGMAPDPAMEASEEAPYDAPAQEPMMASEEPAYSRPVQRPHSHKHHLRMLNVRPSEHTDSQHEAHERRVHELPPNVVRDEMGRAMPVLFAASEPAKGKSFPSRSLDAFVLLCCLLALRLSRE